VAWRIDPRIAWQVVADTVVCVDVDSGMACGFNEVGSFIWPLLDGHDEAAIADRVAANFLVDPDTARTDVGSFLELLRERRLVVEGP
jgi:hypothetical protein